MKSDLAWRGFSRTVRLATYNRRMYAAAGVVFVSSLAIAASPGLASGVRWAAVLAAVVVGWFSCASLRAFYVMFDRAPWLKGEWLPSLLPTRPRRWIQLSLCLEETTLPIAQVFDGAVGRVLDLYHPSVTTERAATLAKQRVSENTHLRALPSSLPVADDWADLVVLTLAAHEIRNCAQRESLFRESRRIASAAGRIVLIEHLRNWTAALAFGPACLHFYPRREWLRLARGADLQVERELALNPLVHVFVFRRPSTDIPRVSK